MAPSSKVYIAGVGYSPSSSKSSSTEASVAASISAITKALLDAGLTYDDITHAVVSKSSEHASEALKTFEDGGVTTSEAKQGSELESSFALVKQKGAQSVLMTADEDGAVVALVLVSEKFLWSRSYLKDSSALLQDQSKSSGKARKKLYDVCKIVWALRGWTDGPSEHSAYQSPSDQHYTVSRADGNDIPKWKDIEHKQDGKHRLGYNPAKKTEEVSSEDFEAVASNKSDSNSKTSRSRFKRRGGDRAALARL